MPAPICIAADVGKVLPGTDGLAIKPQGKTLVPAVTPTSKGKFLIKQTYCHR